MVSIISQPVCRFCIVARRINLDSEKTESRKICSGDRELKDREGSPAMHMRVTTIILVVNGL